jgi:hypothetical protein
MFCEETGPPVTCDRTHTHPHTHTHRHTFFIALGIDLYLRNYWTETRPSISHSTNIKLCINVSIRPGTSMNMQICLCNVVSPVIPFNFQCNLQGNFICIGWLALGGARQWLRNDLCIFKRGSPQLLEPYCAEREHCACGDKCDTVGDKQISGQSGTTATSVNELWKCYRYVGNERKEGAVNKWR